MKEKEITSKESLEIISSMIQLTRQRYIGDGNILLMWGYLITIVSALVWLLIASTGQGVWNWLWFIIPVVGGIATPLMARKQKIEVGAVTYSDKITSRLWTIFGLSEILLTLVCLGFALFGSINCWGAMLIYSILLVPGAEIAQGLIVKEKSLIVGGIIGLTAGAVILCCVVARVLLSINCFMPLFILAWIAMMIIPGHIINHKAKH